MIRKFILCLFVTVFVSCLGMQQAEAETNIALPMSGNLRYWQLLPPKRLVYRAEPRYVTRNETRQLRIVTRPALQPGRVDVINNFIDSSPEIISGLVPIFMVDEFSMASPETVSGLIVSERRTMQSSDCVLHQRSQQLDDMQAMNDLMFLKATMLKQQAELRALSMQVFSGPQDIIVESFIDATGDCPPGTINDVPSVPTAPISGPIISSPPAHGGPHAGNGGTSSGGVFESERRTVQAVSDAHDIPLGPGETLLQGSLRLIAEEPARTEQNASSHIVSQPGPIVSQPGQENKAQDAKLDQILTLVTILENEVRSLRADVDKLKIKKNEGDALALPGDSNGNPQGATPGVLSSPPAAAGQ